MATTATPDIKEQVRDRYGTIALNSTGCCEPGDCCGGAPDALADIQFVDYAALQAEVVDGSDLGLGCGTPTLAAHIQPGETVLDLGSGAGIDVFLAARAVGPEGTVIGVDMTPEMLARAWENAAKAGFKNVDFRKGEIEALPVQSDSVDVILSNCVINLAPDKAPVFAEMYRVLKAGGRFSVSDMVTFGPVPEAVRGDIALWTGCIAGALDRETYLGMIRAAGFRDVRVERETVYDSSDYLPGANGDFGIASVTVVGKK